MQREIVTNMKNNFRFYLSILFIVGRSPCSPKLIKIMSIIKQNYFLEEEVKQFSSRKEFYIVKEKLLSPP